MGNWCRESWCRSFFLLPLITLPWLQICIFCLMFVCLFVIRLLNAAFTSRSPFASWLRNHDILYAVYAFLTRWIWCRWAIRSRKCPVSSLPDNGGVHYSHDDESEDQVPAVTHGDEHHVAVIRLIPLHLAGGVQHKRNLGERPADITQQLQQQSLETLEFNPTL